jgi:hypothetical protein
MISSYSQQENMQPSYLLGVYTIRPTKKISLDGQCVERYVTHHEFSANQSCLDERVEQPSAVAESLRSEQ